MDIQLRAMSDLTGLEAKRDSTSSTEVLVVMSVNVVYMCYYTHVRDRFVECDTGDELDVAEAEGWCEIPNFLSPKPTTIEHKGYVFNLGVPPDSNDVLLLMDDYVLVAGWYHREDNCYDVDAVDTELPVDRVLGWIPNGQFKL